MLAEDENAYVSATAIPKGVNGTSRHWTGTGIRVTDTETGEAGEPMLSRLQ